MASRRINNNKKNTKSGGPTGRNPQPTMVGVATRTKQLTTGVRGTAFRSRERLAAVASSATGVIAQYYWNPGMARTFSLGHKMARSFEKYEVSAGGNSVTYVTSSPSTTAGRIYMYANYDPSDQIPSTEDEFADRSDVRTACLWENLTLTLDHRQMTPGGPKPVRRGETAQDRNITDACTIVVGVFGDGSTSTTVGNMYIAYNAQLLVQRPEPSLPLAPKHTVIARPVSDVAIATSGLTLSNWQIEVNGLNAELADSAPRGVRLYPGAYLLQLDAAYQHASGPGTTVTLTAVLTRDGSGILSSTTSERFPAPGDGHITLHSHCNFIVVTEEAGEVINFATEQSGHASAPLVIASRTRLMITAA